MIQTIETPSRYRIALKIGSIIQGHSRTMEPSTVACLMASLASELRRVSGESTVTHAADDLVAKLVSRCDYMTWRAPFDSLMTVLSVEF